MKWLWAAMGYGIPSSDTLHQDIAHIEYLFVS